MAVDYSTSSSQAKSWPDLIATIVIHDGETLEDIDAAALSWGASRSRGVQMRHGRKFARTRGSTEYSGALTLYDSGWEALRPALVSAANSLGVSIQDVAFDILAIRKPVDSSTVETAKLMNCVISEISADYSEGEDPHQHTLGLDVMNVVEIDSAVEVNLG